MRQLEVVAAHLTPVADAPGQRGRQARLYRCVEATAAGLRRAFPKVRLRIRLDGGSGPESTAAGEKLAKETGLAFVEIRDGDRIEGIYRRPIRLASGKFAAIDKSKELTLVPWRPMLERRRGKIVGGVMRGSSVSFDFTKKRGIGIG